MSKSTVIQDIKSKIRPNGEQNITGQVLQDVLVESVNLVPEKVSELVNDSQYQTKANLDTALASKANASDIPTKTSQLANDSGFTTATEVSTTYATKAEVPTKTSQLTNDSTYQTKANLDTALASKTDIEEVKREVFLEAGGNYEPTLEWESGYLDTRGQIQASTSYLYSKNAVPLKKGDVVTVKTSGNGFTVIAKFEDGLYKPLVVVTQGSVSDVLTYKYQMTENADIVFCVKETKEYSVSVYRDVKPENYTNTVSHTGNISIVAAKEHHYTDGTLPVIEWYLLCDLATRKFYYSEDLTTKKFLFQFPEMEKYSFGIMLNGDIIAVRLAESLPLTKSDSNRVNPYVMKADENWSVIHEVNFGERIVKPCGWLENCGFLAMPNGDTMFVEYTRISVETANVWKISGDVLNPDNWSVKKTFQLSGEPDAGLKHIHNVQNDMYTGNIYISTGDYGASSMYVSRDLGETFEIVLENNEALCRNLAMTFTPDYICYANDSVQHKFIKAPRREDGVIDLDKAEVITLPVIEHRNVASYGQSYIREYNAVLVLDRQDGVPEGTPAEFPLYVVDLKTLKYSEVYTLKGVSKNCGFRTVYTEWYPEDGLIHLGFGRQPNTNNRNRVCGNGVDTRLDGTQTVNNLTIKVGKEGDSYNLRFGTLFI